MFDEMPPEHFHQFIASPPPPPAPTTTPTSTQLPPLHSLFLSTTINSFPPFDNHHHHQQQPPPYNYPSHDLHIQSQFDLLHNKNEDHHHHHHKEVDLDHDHHETQLLSFVLGVDKDQRSSMGDVVDHEWTNEEVFELIRIRSNMENWFPDLTWNHVSRKLAELGFKKSPQNCKQKFEEESQHFTNNINNIVITNTKNYRFFSELEEICSHGDQNPPIAEEDDDDNLPDEDHNYIAQQYLGEDRINQNIMMNREKRKRSSKKKIIKFEKLKEFCEEIVNKMMAQQEELNNKLIHDMLKRDEENLAKEEARKKQETERINKEIEWRAQEHAVAKQRQAKIIEFLNKLQQLEAVASSSSLNPIINTNYLLEKVDDTAGKMIRWPRDEVMALINLRSNYYSRSGSGSGSDDDDDDEIKELGPLWERISKGMVELGYNRSSKRCKEKWENINKYYDKKTKDNTMNATKKIRTLDSRSTCPYFHQLTTLYNQTAFTHPENHNLLRDHDDGINEDNDGEGVKRI